MIHHLFERKTTEKFKDSYVGLQHLQCFWFFLNSYALPCAEFESSFNLIAESFMGLQTLATSIACWNWIINQI